MIVLSVASGVANSAAALSAFTSIHMTFDMLCTSLLNTYVVTVDTEGMYKCHHVG